MNAKRKPARRSAKVARIKDTVVAVRLDGTVEMFAFPVHKDAVDFAMLAREMGAEAIVGTPIDTAKEERKT